jgi:hypothetical protein
LLVGLAVSEFGGAVAAEPSRFVPAKFKAAELRFVEGIPIATVAGSPEQIGEQLGQLFKQPLTELLSKREDVAHGFGLAQPPGIIVKAGRFLLPMFPDAQRREIMAEAKAAGADVDVLTFENIVYDLSRFPACSSLAVESARSSTGGPIFGRNLDFPTFGFLDKYSVVVCYRPEAKHAFATVTFPGMAGVFSGINDAGLCLAQLEVNYSADKSPRVSLTGTPVAMCFRRLLEECTTIDEAEKLLREQNRMMICNLAMCDRQQSVVLEVTPKNVVRRPSAGGFCPCTNHFRTKELGGPDEYMCSRYQKLSKCFAMDKLGIADVAHLLDSANQGRFTMQTMVFEPATLTAFLSFGPAPSSAQPLKQIDLAKLLGAEK